ncbi:hypothetical protein RhiJN_05250 [Ceratobasidium sp. AG-Ba]|nr:hypothetical protein RhiJN_05250 [Ceratobasidium sp. AG-Ba]
MPGILKIFNILDVNGSSSRRLLIETLREKLNEKSSCIASCSKALSNTLWQSSLGLAISASLKQVFASVAMTLLRVQGSLGDRLRYIVQTSGTEVLERINYDKSLEKHLAIVHQEHRALYLAEKPDVAWTIENNKEPRSRASTTKSQRTNYSDLTSHEFADHEGQFEWLAFDSSSLKHIRALYSAQVLEKLYEYHTLEGGLEAVTSHVEEAVSATTYISAVIDQVTPDWELNCPNFPLLLAYHLDFDVLVELIEALVCPRLPSLLESAILEECHGFRITRGGIATISDLQKSYIRRSITARAELLPRRHRSSLWWDMENTMSLVWKALPIDFGGAIKSQDNDPYRDHSDLALSNPGPTGLGKTWIPKYDIVEPTITSQQIINDSYMLNIKNHCKQYLKRIAYSVASHQHSELSRSIPGYRSLSDRVISFSGSYLLELPFEMKFHQTWNHEECKVIQWYRAQSGYGTNVRAVEHRKSTQNSLHHEFLLLKLDGGTYLVERTGSGSQTDAMRHKGCISRDQIRRLSDSDYKAIQKTSERISEIEFIRQFDLIDVLAICYSIQRTKACSVYTLQRYNCYYFCLTIIAVLSRRVAEWETRMDAIGWDKSIDSTLHAIKELSFDVAHEHSLLKVCQLLVPSASHYGIQVAEIIRPSLKARPDYLENYSTAISKTLWFCSDHSCSYASLVRGFKYATQDLIHNESEYAKELLWIVETDCTKTIKEIDRSPSLGKLLLNTQQKLVKVSSSAVISQYKHTDDLPRPRDNAHLGWDELIAVGLPKFALAHIRTLCSQRVIKQLKAEKHRRNSLQYVTSLVEKAVLTSESLNHILDVWNFNGVAELIGSLVDPTLQSELKRYLIQREPSILIHENASADACTEQHRPLRVSDLQQDYLKKRIWDHAKHVESVGLGDALSIRQGMESAIAEVWKTMPAGYGCASACIKTSGDDV